MISLLLDVHQGSKLLNEFHNNNKNVVTPLHAHYNTKTPFEQKLFKLGSCFSPEEVLPILIILAGATGNWYNDNKYSTRTNRLTKQSKSDWFSVQVENWIGWRRLHLFKHFYIQTTLWKNCTAIFLSLLLLFKQNLFDFVAVLSTVVKCSRLP